MSDSDEVKPVLKPTWSITNEEVWLCDKVLSKSTFYDVLEVK